MFREFKAQNFWTRFSWNLFRNIIKHVKRCLGGFEELQTYCRSQMNLPVCYVPVDRGTWQLSLTRKVTCHSSPLCSNTNTDSGVLAADIFNYRVSTFISSHLLPYSLIDASPFFIFQALLYFRGEGGGEDHNNFIQLLWKCFRFW